MPDDQDYADLREPLSRPEQWTTAEAARARMLRKQQAAAVADYDQRDRSRVASMQAVVRQLNEVLATWEASRQRHAHRHYAWIVSA
jgi:hypothetical protein